MYTPSPLDDSFQKVAQRWDIGDIASSCIATLDKLTVVMRLFALDIREN